MGNPQPMDLKPAEHLGRAQWEVCLRWAFAAMCAAMAWRGFSGDQLFSLLFITCDWSESAAMATNRVVAGLFAASGLLVLWLRSWWGPLIVGGLMAGYAVVTMAAGGAYTAYVPGTWAVRYGAPLGLAVAVWWRSRGQLSRRRMGLILFWLQAATAATFALHGLKALDQFPPFQDYLFMAGNRIGVSLSQELVETMLEVIGVVDLLVAAILLIAPRGFRVWVAYYMAFWGFVTAASRTVHSGWPNAHETLLRMPNGAVPLALGLFWLSAERARRDSD